MGAVAKGLKWRVTEPSGRSHTDGYDQGRVGWKRHAVRDGEPKALCGLRPRLGWGCDLFEDEMDECSRCRAALNREAE